MSPKASVRERRSHSDRALLPPGGQMLQPTNLWNRQVLLQQDCVRAQFGCSCWASGWSGLTSLKQSSWTPVNSDSELWNFRTLLCTTDAALIQSNERPHLSGNARAGGSRLQLLLLKQASLPGHLVQQEQGPLGHIWGPRHLRLLRLRRVKMGSIFNLICVKADDMHDLLIGVIKPEITKWFLQFCSADLCSLSQSLHLLLDGSWWNPLPGAGQTHHTYSTSLLRTQSH